MNQAQISKQVWQSPTYFIAFGFGSGLLPLVPGTWGTLAAIPIYYLIANFSCVAYLLISLLAFILGVFVSERVTRDLGMQDYKGIVWDEIVGYLLTMFLAPPGWIWMFLGFVLFRFFDILKPYPIRLVDEKVHGGLGIMLDDVLAALPAWLIMHVLFWGFVSK